MVTVEDTIWLLGGTEHNGVATSYETYVLEANSQSWERGPDLIASRSRFGCGVMKMDIYEGKDVIVVAGGTNLDGKVLDTVEFHVIGSDYWLRGNYHSNGS